VWLHHSDSRRRWIATAHVGFQPDGKRIGKGASGKTRTEGSSSPVPPKMRTAPDLRFRRSGAVLLWWAILGLNQ